MQEWTVKSLLEWSIEYFSKKETPQPRLSAELLLSSVLKLSRINLYLNYERILTREELASFKALILKRLENRPIQYILNEAYFRKIKLYVDENVLIPRPETELLVEETLKAAEEISKIKNEIAILEIGTGSGAIAISIASEIGEIIKNKEFKWKICATDNNFEAINIARKNASIILSKEQLMNIIFCLGDILPEKSKGECNVCDEIVDKADVIVSNPPYISQKDYVNLPVEVKKYEPKSALLSGETGLEVYEKILDKIHGTFSDGKFILFETDPNISLSLKDLISKKIDIGRIEILKDYNGLDRILICR